MGNRFDFVFEVGGGPHGNVADQFRNLAGIAHGVGARDTFAGADLSPEGFLDLALRSAGEEASLSFVVAGKSAAAVKPLADAIVEAGFSMLEVCFPHGSREKAGMRFASGRGFDVTFQGSMPSLSFQDVANMARQSLETHGGTSDAALGKALRSWLDNANLLAGALEPIRLLPQQLAAEPVAGPSGP